ncbi:Bug family tripartite tricarboxylate transporter substrate binding protein [Quisquiliibacterium transsilvanicum]|uniref:Tripartite-type tricarboxylate transporter receptor subunit TctC n=1 Tax=Quisquiliibacterium transsilvanicum TaxID=1549638 RepID=A0A7W8HKD0_9BURK|nr:tripartite tricarboxylate transporter substrate binding protein [Quisquiliibacterium transsilvanicum]MBB5273676.1 tripartite-type tricarboxylate transporter receptor subunit TctC [Quisquiliibacterium transsilvanicum]
MSRGAEAPKAKACRISRDDLRPGPGDGRRALLGACAAIALTPRASLAAQAGWPERPLRVLVPFAPGGTVDLSARLLAPRLAERLGQPVVVENRPGASGNLAIESVARAPADGYTLLYAPTALVINPHLVRGSLDPLRALAPISMVSRNWLTLLARRDLPVRDVAGLLALARARPGAVTCGTAGGMPQLGCLLFESLAAVDLNEIPYKGMGPATLDLAAGSIDLLFGVGAISQSFVESGRARALAITAGARRAGWTEGLPTLSETLPGYVLEGWEGLLAPAGTDAAIVERLSREIAVTLAEPAVRSRLVELSLEPVGSAPAEFARAIARDMKRVGEIAARAGLEPQ